MNEHDATRRPQSRFSAGALETVSLPITMADEPATTPGTDPWVHRSEGMRCKKCIWFVPKQANNKPSYDIGRCRRHAPTMNGYPVVFVNDWCGDHRIDENKI